jgi:hypothetical protein
LKLLGTMTIKELIQELKKYDEKSIVMLSKDPDGKEVIEVDRDMSPAYRSDTGEVFFEEDLPEKESARSYDRVIIFWPIL